MNVVKDLLIDSMENNIKNGELVLSTLKKASGIITVVTVGTWISTASCECVLNLLKK